MTLAVSTRIVVVTEPNRVDAPWRRIYESKGRRGRRRSKHTRVLHLSDLLAPVERQRAARMRQEEDELNTEAERPQRRHRRFITASAPGRCGPASVSQSVSQSGAALLLAGGCRCNVDHDSTRRRNRQSRRWTDDCERRFCRLRSRINRHCARYSYRPKSSVRSLPYVAKRPYVRTK